MDGIFAKLIDAIQHGGMAGVVSILLGFIILLIYDRHRLESEIVKKDEKIEKIVENYYQGNITITEALHSLRLVLTEIKGKL
jgi:hypothetical protein